MKKFIILILCLSLILTSCNVFGTPTETPSTGTSENTPENETEKKDDSSITLESGTTISLTKQSVYSDSPNKYRVVDSYVYSDGNYYYFYELGTIDAIPINIMIGESTYHSGKITNEKTLKMTSVNIEQRTVEIKNSVNNSLNIESSSYVKSSISASAYEALESKIESGISANATSTIGSTMSESMSTSIQNQSITEATQKIVLNENHPEGYYFYAYIASVKVYGVVIYNPNTDTIEHISTYNQFSVAVPGIYYSEDGFVNNIDFNITFSEDNLPDFTTPNKKIDSDSVRLGFDGGSGTTNDPYIIGGELNDVVRQMMLISSYPNAHYKLTTDIDFDDHEDGLYEIIVTEPFGGTFDGGGHTLSGWSYYQKSGGSIGLFDTINSSGVVKNLIIEDFTVKFTTDVDPSGSLNAGLLCGTLYGSVERVIVRDSYIDVDMGSISSDKDNNTNVGGIIGKSIGGKIESCGSESNYIKGYAGTEYHTANCAAGGIIGKADGKTVLKNSYSYGNSKIQATPKRSEGWFDEGTAYGSAGGLIGNTDGDEVKISRCLAYNNKIEKPDSDQYTNFFRGSLVGHISGYVVAPDSYGGNGYQILGGYNLDGTNVSIDGATMLSKDIVNVSEDLPSLYSKTGWTSIGGNPCIVMPEQD